MLYDEPQNSPEATFTQIPTRDPIKPVRFPERKFAFLHSGQSVFVPVLVLFTRVHNRIGRKHFPPKQTKEMSFAELQNSSNTAEREVIYIPLNLEALAK